MAGINVGIVGATGQVGGKMLDILRERAFPVESLRLFASARSAGRRLGWNGDEVEVEDAATADYRGLDIALFSAGGSRSLEFAPTAVRAGALVIDNSSAFRMDDKVPLVVPEINPEDLSAHRGIIANPNCTTIILLMAVNPLRPAGIRRLVVSSYQAVSGAGAKALEELKAQTLSWALGQLGAEVLGEPIAQARDLVFAVVVPGNHQGGDLDPDVGLVAQPDQRIEHRLQIGE